jgi:hypothetical protein
MNCDVRRATFKLHKCRKTVWRPGSARTRSLRSSQRSPRPLAGCRGPLRGGRGGEGKGEGRGGKEEKEGWEGKEEMDGREGREGKDHGAVGFRRRAASYFCGAATVENLSSRRRIFYGVVRLKSYPTLWHIFSQYLVYNGNYQQDTT